MSEEKFGAGDPLSKRILNSIKPFSGEQTSKWLAALSSDESGEKLIDIGDTPDPDQEPARPMQAWVDRLFDQFQRYSFDFGRMCNEPHLQVNCSRPPAQDPKPPGQEATVTSQGYLSTQQWAMVIRGEFDKIQAFVIPVGLLMGFNSRNNDYVPYMEMTQGLQNKNKYIWILDNQPVSFDQSAAIAKRLFAHLVMVSRGEAKDTERFSFLGPDQRPKELPAKPGSGSNKVELLKPEWLLSEEPTPLKQQSQTVPPGLFRQQGQIAPGAPFVPPLIMPKGSLSKPGQSLPRSQPPANMTPPQMPPAPPRINPVTPQPPSPQTASTQPSAKGSMDELLDQNLSMVLDDCNRFCEALDRHLEVLTPLGVKAIQTQDMTRASEIMQRAKKLKALLDNMVKFTNECKTENTQK